MPMVPRRLPRLRIHYESDAFPPGTVANGFGDLIFGWDDLLWAAITLGRPSLHAVFAHGDASYHEAIFRLSTVRMAVEQRSLNGWRLFRTDAFKQLDPTEKGAVSYFLGMAVCKLFADRLLGAPWLLHLDAFRAQIGATLLAGRSRPDLVGQVASTGAWHAFECKGRATSPNADDKAKAKVQAQRLISVGGSTCALHIGAFTYFRKDTLQFYWRDPEPKGAPLKVPEPETAWGLHYAPVVALLRRSESAAPDGGLTPVVGLDLSVGVHPYIADALFKGDWARAHAQARQHHAAIIAAGYEADGIAIRTGDTWLQRFRPLEDFEGP